MRVLLADDNPDMRKCLAILIKALGYTVDTANDGIEVLEKLTNEQYQLLLMDINMPRLNGIDTARQIISDNVVHPKIVIMTGHSISNIDTGIPGVDTFLAKPFSLSQLKEVIAGLNLAA